MELFLLHVQTSSRAKKEAITTAFVYLEKNEKCLSAAELEQLSKAIAILQPFETATTELSAETYISVSKIIPIARSLQQVALSNDTSTSINKELVSQMRTRFSNMEGNAFLSKATLLDPRFKSLAFLNPIASNNSVESLIGEISLPQPQPQEDSPPLPQSNSLWQAFDARVADKEKTREAMSGIRFESRQYLQDHVLQS